MSDTVSNKPIICIDFDGVIHSYERGWQGGVIYGNVTEGFFEWALEAQKHFNLVVYSSRSSEPEGLEAMKKWFWDQARKQFPNDIPEFRLEFAHQKPPAYLTIDDRAITFNGDWSVISVEFLKNFKPWMYRG
jgi:hypothetical protein